MTTTNEQFSTRPKLLIRLSRGRLDLVSLDAANTERPIDYQPYSVNSGISMAANLREALRTAELLQHTYQRVMVMVNAQPLMVPVDLYDETQKELLYRHSFPSQQPDVVMASVVPDLNCVALYPINRDLKQVIDEHFTDVRYLCAASPVWRYLYRRSFTGVRSKLYGYFHDQQLDIFSYHQNRFKFCNTFSAAHMQDSVYYLLYVWQQLGLRQEHDELHIVGDIPEREEMMTLLSRYLKRAYIINPSGDFNRSPATQIQGLPYDMVTMIVKGR
ncbi:MAG: DUF3822 family protein [Prevotella sp.]|nr:DUF3822 family protein [Prevotella sp.]